jgi:hypothetical protein
MTLNSLLETTKYVVPSITGPELVILMVAWMRIFLDQDDADHVIRWARKQVGLLASEEELRELQRTGASVRRIAGLTGLSKSSVARRLSRSAA